MLKNLLYIISEESVNDIKFTPYRLNSMTQNNTMIEIFIQQNSFLDIVKIVLVFWIIQKDKEQVQDIIGQSQYLRVWNLHESQKVKVNTR